MAAQQLSKAGATAAAQAQQNSVLSSDAFAHFQDAEAFHQGIVKNETESADAKTIQSDMADIQKELTARANVFQSLSSAYTALGNLAAYSASTDFNTAFDGLSKSVTTYRSVLHLPAVSGLDVKAIEAGGDFLLGLEQKDAVVTASKQIHAVLNTTIASMSDPLTTAQFTTFQAVGTEDATSAAQVLYAKGYYSSTPMLTSLGSPMSLSLVANSDAMVAKDDSIHRGLGAVLRQRAQRQQDAIITSYQQSEAALKALVPLHERLENGEPLDFSEIVSITGELAATANSLATASTPPKK